MNAGEVSRVIKNHLFSLRQEDTESFGFTDEESTTDDDYTRHILDHLREICRHLDIDLESLRSETRQIGDAGGGIVDEARARLARDKPPVCSLRTFSEIELEALAKLGRVTRLNIFDDACADRVPSEIDRLVDEGLIGAASDRVAEDGTPLEWITNQGAIWQANGDSAVLEASASLKSLYESMIDFAESYNAALRRAAAAPQAVPVAPEGIELNVNCVLGGDAGRWSGLHSHRDTARFTDSMQQLPETSVKHAAIRARALTVSVYFRRPGERTSEYSNGGGALTFMVPSQARGPHDRAVFDVVPADHNAGAIFFPGTVHGVAAMPATGSVRYSAQAFFPSAEAWASEIKPRIDRGELRREPGAGQGS